MQGFLTFFASYQILAVFVGSFLFGDSVIFTAAYLAGQEAWSLIIILGAALGGTLLSDALWFLGGAWAQRRFAGAAFLKKEREKALDLVSKLAGIKPYAALVYVKFLYGARVAMILYAAAREVPFWTFMFFNGIGTILWFAVFFPVAYLIGRGANERFPDIGFIEAAIFVLIVSTVGFRILTVWITKKVTRQ